MKSKSNLSQWWLPLTLLLVGLMPCQALELLISDSGRNTSWTPQLKTGDSFDAVGADNKPVAGVFNMSSTLGQFLLPMPGDLELTQMSKSQEDNLVKGWGELIRDRVQIAVMNREPNFEIRLLQNTPTPRNPAESWAENPNADRFARVAYASIAKTVNYLKERDTPVKITAALADSGAGTFARATDAWSPYALAFRRADLVQGLAGLKETRDAINTLGATRIRLFLNPSSPSIPPMSIGRLEVAQNLVAGNPRLCVFQLASLEKPFLNSHDLLASADSRQLLFGVGVFTYQRLDQTSHRESSQPVVVESLSSFLRPCDGWDPQNTHLNSGEAVEKMGVFSSASTAKVVPVCEGPSAPGAMITQSSSTGGGEPSTLQRVEIGRDTANLLVADSLALGNTLKTLNDPQFANVFKNPAQLAALEKTLGVGGKNFENVLKGLDVANTVLDYAKSVQDDIQRSQGSRSVSIPFNTLNTTIDTFAKFSPIPDFGLLEQKTAILQVSLNGRVDNESITHMLDAGVGGAFGVLGAGWAIEHGIVTPQGIAASAKTFEEIGLNSARTSRAISQNWGGWDAINKANPWDTDSRAFPQRMADLRSENDLNNLRSTTYKIATIMTAFNPPANNNMPKSATLDCSSMSDATGLSSMTKSWATSFATKLVENPVMNLGGMDGAVKEAFQQSPVLSQYTLKTGPVFGDGPNVCTERPFSQPSFTPTSQQFGGNTWQPPSMPMNQSSFDNVHTYQMPNFNQDLKFSMPSMPTFQPDVRGVLLQAAAHVEGEPVRASELGLVFQDAGGVMDLTKLRRLETAMWAAYLSVEGPGISIDPVDPHVNTHHVRHLGIVRNTDLGRVMRETDYLMKRWAVGTYRPEIPGFLSPDEISAKAGNRVLGRPSRFWLLPQGITFKRAGGMLVLASGHMTVQTEYLEDNPDGKKNPENEKFAEWFTEHYDQIAAKYPIYQELFEYAQLVGLSTYLKEQKMPLLWFLLKNREMMLTEQAIDDVPALAKRSSAWYVNISGGVELEATKTVRDQANISDDISLAKSLGQARADVAIQSGSDRQVLFNDKSTSYSISQAGSLSLSGTSASGDIVQTDFSHFEEYGETAGTNSWKLVTPGLELIRHYSPELHSAAQFGPGWHLAVPFHLTAGDNVVLQPDQPPLLVEVHNVLSGEMEALQLTRITNNGMETLGYVPTEKNGFDEHLSLSDGTWHIQDCLGVNLWFDSNGDLTKMELRPDKEVPVKLGEKVLRKIIPGYSVNYHYLIEGDNTKRLDSIDQGGMKADIQWDDSVGVPRIGAIQVKRVAESSELIQYHYNSDGQLTSVQTPSGTLEIKYQDNGMRVLASNK